MQSPAMHPDALLASFLQDRAALAFTANKPIVMEVGGLSVPSWNQCVVMLI